MFSSTTIFYRRTHGKSPLYKPILRTFPGGLSQSLEQAWKSFKELLGQVHGRPFDDRLDREEVVQSSGTF